MSKTETARIERDCLAMATAEFKRVFERAMEKPMPNNLLRLSEQAQKYQECWIDLMAAERKEK